MIGAILQRQRTQQGMSLGKLALLAGVHRSTLSRWEAGKTTPLVTELELVLEALELPQELCHQCWQHIDRPRAMQRLTPSAPADTPTLPVSGGELLRALRRRSGCTQSQVSVALGVTQSLLSHWENNSAWPDEEKLLLLCRRLGATRGEWEGLRAHGWRNHEELPRDKDELDARLYATTQTDTQTDRDLIYLAFAARYETLRRKNKLSDLDAMEAWGVYAYHLFALGREQEAVALATPLYQAIQRSSRTLTRGQLEALMTITDNMGWVDHQAVFRGREILLGFEGRIPVSHRSFWHGALGMIHWHCGRRGNLPELTAASDRYFEYRIQETLTELDGRRRRVRYAGILCHQHRFEEALNQLSLAPALNDPWMRRQVEFEQNWAWALAELGNWREADRHFVRANDLLAAHPDFLERHECLPFVQEYQRFVENKGRSALKSPHI